MRQTMMITRQGRRWVRGLAAVVALATLLAVAPAVEAGFGYYTTSFGRMPFVYRGWGYYLARLGSQNPAPAPAPTTGAYQPTAAEKHAVDLINADRAKNGLPALALNAGVTRVAHLKAQDMAVNGYFDHNSPTYGSPFDMLTKFGISYRAAGENIALAGSVDQAEQLFMNSSGHRANILNATYNQVGVGVYVGSDGRTYVSQMFIRS